MSRRMLLQSRQFSCSELGDGSRELVATKQETLNDDDLEANIKDIEEQLRILRSKRSQASTPPQKPRRKPVQETHDEDHDESEGEEGMEDEEEEEEPSPVESPPPAQPSKLRRTAAKGKANKPAETQQPVPARRPINTPARASAGVPNPATGQKKPVLEVVATPKKKTQPRNANEDPKQKPSSARSQLAQPVMAPDAESPALHRVKGKQSPDAKDELIRKLYAEVEALKLRTPSTASSAKPRKPKSADPKTTPQTEAAKENRLRRLCEQKPSGRINVPKEVHDRWAQGGEVRKTLLAELEAADWDKDSFLSRVTKTSEKRNQTSAHKKRGWYTMEGMATILKWSKSYIKGVVKTLSQPGNEHLVKRDRYDKKVKKYYVLYGEDDSDDDKQIDSEKHEECEVGKTRLGLTGPTKGGLDKLPEQPESEEDPSDDEDGKRGKSAVELTQGQQELNSFKKFSDSLLSKSAKMHNLLSELEDFIPNIPDGADKKKAHRTATALEKIIEVLEKESESMEVCRAECSMLNNKNISEKDKERLIKKLDDHLQKTTVACSSATTTETTAKNLLKKLQKAVES